MLTRIFFFDFSMLVLDLVTISFLRKFLFDFLRGKNGKLSKAVRAYKDKSSWDDITLTYLKSCLKKHFKEFDFFHRIYLAVIYTFIPQYIIIFISNELLGMKSLYIVGFFVVIKFIVFLIIRIHTNSGLVSIYRNSRRKKRTN